MLAVLPARIGSPGMTSTVFDVHVYIILLTFISEFYKQSTILELISHYSLVFLLQTLSVSHISQWSESQI